MKYLKLFEDLNDFYSTIDYQEYNRMLSIFLPEKFSKYEIDKIKHILKIWEERKEVSELEVASFGDICGFDFGGKILGHEIEIRKIRDGWYLLNSIPRDAYTFANRNKRSIESYRKFYKCDQFDGVLQYLKNELGRNTTNSNDDSLFNI